jgi:hypothetical protein
MGGISACDPCFCTRDEHALMRVYALKTVLAHDMVINLSRDRICPRIVVVQRQMEFHDSIVQCMIWPVNSLRQCLWTRGDKQHLILPNLSSFIIVSCLTKQKVVRSLLGIAPVEAMISRAIRSLLNLPHSPPCSFTAPLRNNAGLRARRRGQCRRAMALQRRSCGGGPRRECQRCRTIV